MPPRILSESEFNDLRDQVLKAAPDGLDEAGFNRYVGPAMEQALGKAENSTAPLSGSALSRFASGVWQNLNPVAAVKGIVQAGMHPIDTASQLLAAQGAEFQKAKAAPTMTEAAGHFAAGLLPVVGPMAARAGEQIASGDVAGGMGQATGLVAPFGAADAARALGKAWGVVPKAVSAKLEEAAAAKVADVMSPKVGPNKTRFGAQAAKVAPELLQAGDVGGFTRTALQANVESKLGEAQDALDAASDARLSARSFPTQPIIADLTAKRNALMAQPVEASRIVPSVTSGSARGIPVDPGRTYALKWMLDEMQTFPFEKKRFDFTVPRQGGTPDVFGGAAGAPIYRAIIGEEDHPIINASRADVMKAIIDVSNGRSEGRLRGLVADVADRLAAGDPAVQKRMNTPGPNLEPGDLATVRWRDISGKKEPPALTKEGRPIGQAVLPGPNADRARAIDEAIAEIKQLGPMAQYEPLRRIRQAYDQPAKVKYLPSLTQDYLKNQGYATGAADVTGSLREALAKFDPETAKANAQYSLYKRASDVLQATEEVQRTRPKVGRQIAARMAGSILGEQAAGVPGAAAGFVLGPILDQALSSGVTTKLQTARLLSGLADAIRKGDLGQATSLSVRLKRIAATQGAISTGQTTAPTEAAIPAPTP